MAAVGGELEPRVLPHRIRQRFERASIVQMTDVGTIGGGDDHPPAVVEKPRSVRVGDAGAFVVGGELIDFDPGGRILVKEFRARLERGHEDLLCEKKLMGTSKKVL
jgi:hypothetical protein